MAQQDGPPTVPRHWQVQPWRILPPALVLATVALIWVTRFEQLLANQWAYPVTLLVVGSVAALLLWRARPRRASISAGTSA